MLATSGNTANNSADNEVGSTVSWHSLTPLHYGKGMSYYSSITHDLTDEYSATIFYRILA